MPEFGKNGIPALPADQTEADRYRDHKFGVAGLSEDAAVVLDVLLLGKAEEALQEALKVVEALTKDPMYAHCTDEDWKSALYAAFHESVAPVGENANEWLHDELPKALGVKFQWDLG